VHSETGIDQAGASVVSVALDRAVDVLGDLAGRRANSILTWNPTEMPS